MAKKYVLLYHKDAGFGDVDSLVRYDTSYKDAAGKAVTIEQAVQMKRDGVRIIYPKSEVRYHFFVVPQAGGYTVLTGRPMEMSGGGCPIRDVAKKCVDVCLWEDLNVRGPSMDMLETTAALVKGIISSEGIEARRVLPARYFNKHSDSPGLLFNVRRFVREYITG